LAESFIGFRPVALISGDRVIRSPSPLEQLAARAGADPEHLRRWLEAEVERRRESTSSTVAPKPGKPPVPR
jgi:hypothetical protein